MIEIITLWFTILYVSPDLFYDKQINDVEADRDLNAALQNMNSSEWRLIGKAMRLLILV